MREVDKELILNSNLGIRKSKNGKYCLCVSNHSCPDDCTDFNIFSFDDFDFINDDRTGFDKIMMKDFIKYPESKVKKLYLEKLHECPNCHKYHYYNFCTNNPNNKCLKDCYIVNNDNCRFCKYHIIFNFFKDLIKTVLNPKSLKRYQKNGDLALENYISLKLPELIFISFIPYDKVTINANDIIKILESLIFTKYLNYSKNDPEIIVFRNALLYCKLVSFLGYLKGIIASELKQISSRQRKFSCEHCEYFNIEKILNCFNSFFLDIEKCILNKSCLHRTIVESRTIDQNLFIKKILKYVEVENRLPNIQSDCSQKNCPFKPESLIYRSCNPYCFLNYIVDNILSKLLSFGYIFYGNNNRIGSFWDPVKLLASDTSKMKEFPSIHFVFNPLRLFWHNSKAIYKIFSFQKRTEPYYFKEYFREVIYREYYQKIFFPINIKTLASELEYIFEGITLFQNMLGVNQDTQSKEVASAIFNKMKDTIEQLIIRGRKKINVSIVDLGCGTGNFLGNFLKCFIETHPNIEVKFDIYLIDLDSSAIEEKLAENNIRKCIPEVRCNITSKLLNFLKDECYQYLEDIFERKKTNFDIIFCNQVLDMYSKIDLILEPNNNSDFIWEFTSMLKNIEDTFEFLKNKRKLSAFNKNFLQPSLKNDKELRKILNDGLRSLFKGTLNNHVLLNSIFYLIFRSRPEVQLDLKNYKNISYIRDLGIQTWIYRNILDYAKFTNLIAISDRIISNKLLRMSEYYRQNLSINYEIPDQNVKVEIGLFKLFLTTVRRK